MANDKTFNQQLYEAMVAHQVGLLRFAGSVRVQIWNLLDATERDLRRQIKRYAKGAGFDAPLRVQRLERLLTKLRETRLKGWRQARDVWFQEMRALATAEPLFVDALIKSTFPVELSTTIPSPERLRRIVTSQPFMGKTLKTWADKIQADDIARIEDAIKIGLTQNETIPQLARRVTGTVGLNGRDGVTQITRRGASSLARTITSGIANEARTIYLQANSDLAPEELFTATLDSRTTPVCRANDGKRFKVGEGPRLPLHFGERSLYSPVISGEVIGERPQREFTRRQLLREFANERGLKVPTTRGGLPHGSKGAFDSFARQRMRELTGRVPAATSYQEWLSGRSASFQDDILGPTRGALFRRGDLRLDQFVSFDGTELTLAQLAASYSEAFSIAGIDPSQFL